MVTIESVSKPQLYGSSIRDLLALSDDEFVPPLSSRNGTTQTEGLDEQCTNGLDDYYRECLDQSLVVAHEGDQVYGFLSFRDGYEAEELGECVPSIYVSTLLIAPEHRREGYARALYKELLTNLPASVQEPYVTTRTWSMNASHLSLLDELGFELLTRIEDDRGDGIDTVYYGIPVDEFDC